MEFKIKKEAEGRYVVFCKGCDGLFYAQAWVTVTSDVTVVNGQYQNWVFNDSILTKNMQPYNGKFIDKSRWTNKAAENSTQVLKNEEGEIDSNLSVVLEMLEAVCQSAHSNLLTK